MKKLFLPLLLLIVLVLSACGSNNGAAGGSSSDNGASSKDSGGSKTITYQSENGPIKVPAHPKRVVALSGYAGDFLALGVPLVGVDSFTKTNPNFQKQLKNVTAVSDEHPEKIMELKPDLIIAGSDVKNAGKLKQIAPLVTYTYNKVDYLTQYLEIAKAVNQKQKAAKWIAGFKKNAKQAGKDIKAKIGADKTVTVMEGDSKNLYVFGDAWGRGTEVLYQAMGLKMPDKVKKMTAKDGYYDLSLEVLPQYLGDYVIFSKDPDADNSFQKTETYKKIPAVKNKHVFEVNAKTFYYNDPLSLDYQLDFIKKSFLGSR